MRSIWSESSVILKLVLLANALADPCSDLLPALHLVTEDLAPPDLVNSRLIPLVIFYRPTSTSYPGNIALRTALRYFNFLSAYNPRPDRSCSCCT